MSIKLPDFFLKTQNPELKAGKGKNNFKIFDKVIRKSAGTLNFFLELSILNIKCGFLQTISHISFILLITILFINSLLIKIEHLMVLFIFLNFSATFLFTIYGQKVTLHSLSGFYKKILPPVFFFGFLLSFPAIFNIITPGNEVLKLINFGRESEFWIYNIPANISITSEGILISTRMILRVFNAVSSSFLFFSIYYFEDFLMSLQKLKLPYTLILLLSIFHKYIIIMMRVTRNYYLTLISRLIIPPDNKLIKELTGNRALNLFRLTSAKYKNISMAMKSRGYNI